MAVGRTPVGEEVVENFLEASIPSDDADKVVEAAVVAEEVVGVVLHLAGVPSSSRRPTQNSCIREHSPKQMRRESHNPWPLLVFYHAPIPGPSHRRASKKRKASPGSHHYSIVHMTRLTSDVLLCIV